MPELYWKVKREKEPALRWCFENKKVTQKNKNIHLKDTLALRATFLLWIFFIIDLLHFITLIITVNLDETYNLRLNDSIFLL